MIQPWVSKTSHSLCNVHRHLLRVRDGMFMRKTQLLWVCTCTKITAWPRWTRVLCAHSTFNECYTAFSKTELISAVWLLNVNQVICPQWQFSVQYVSEWQHHFHSTWTPSVKVLSVCRIANHEWMRQHNHESFQRQYSACRWVSDRVPIGNSFIECVVNPSLTDWLPSWRLRVT